MLRQPRRGSVEHPAAAGSGRRRRRRSRRARPRASASLRRRARRRRYLPSRRRPRGCATAMPCSSANAFTGDGVQLHAAPGRAGRAGVRTQRDVEAGGVQPRERDARELRRAGEDDSHRPRLGAMPAQALARSSRVFFSILVLMRVALERAQVLDEHLAEQVIHLVLDADREQALGSNSRGSPSRSSARTLDARVALDTLS